MKTLLIDDDQFNLELLESFCSRYAPFIEIVGKATTVDEGIKETIQKKPDLLLLDIELYDQKGFEILEAIHNPDLLIIVITAFKKYAFESYQQGVISFLTKPLMVTDFVRETLRMKKIFDERQPSLKFVSVHNNLNNEDIYVSVNDILHLESEGNYTHLHTFEQRKYISSKPISYYEEKLDNKLFQRVHRSHIVNMKGVKGVAKTSTTNMFIKLVNQQEIPVAEGRRKDFLNGTI